MSRILLPACLALALLAGAFGSAQAQSEAGAQSLLIAPGARSDGMGHTGVAFVGDGNSVWWNSAALGLRARTRRGPHLYEARSGPRR
jgi:hypothetical protein